MNTVSKTQSTHLTDDQFAECTTDAPGAEARAHLDGCADCRAELDAFQASVAGFSMASMSWSQAQPAVSLRAAEVASKRQPLLAYAATAAVAGLLVAAGAPLLRHHHAELQERASVEHNDSAAQIAEDNRMMQTVNLAIDVREPSPIREYRLADVGVARSSARAETRSE